MQQGHQVGQDHPPRHLLRPLHPPGCGSKENKSWPIYKLGAGQCITKTHVRSGALLGTFTAWAFGNGTCNEGELVETNNYLSAKYTVALPDVHLSAFSAKVVDRTVTFSATVCNKGATTTKSFDLEVFYDRTVAPGCGSKDDQHYLFSAWLGAGKCVTRTFTRGGAPPGTFTAYAFADGDCSFNESDETNNTTSAKYTVARPDVYVSAFTAKVVDRAVTFSATVCNKGSSTVKKFDLELFYNRTSAPGCGSKDDQHYQLTAGLGAGKCVTRTFTRSGAPPGTFTAYAFADGDCDLNESGVLNNTGWAGYTVARPDLVVSTLTAKVAGQQVTLAAAVCNKGSSALKQFSLKLFWNRTSAPGCGSSADQQVLIKGLAAGKCGVHTFSLASAPYGGFTAWAMADGACAVTESSELNNTKQATYSVLQPDLQVSAFTVKATGATLDYSVTVCNKGAGITSAFDIDLFYDLSAVPGCATKRDQGASIAGLAAGKCATRTFKRTGTPTGSYKSWVMADGGCKISESSEVNQKSLNISVGKPDLTITQLSAVVTGGKVTFEVKLCNSGAAASKPFTLGLYLNRAAAPGCGHTPDLSTTISSLWGSGSCVTRTFVRPSTKPGAYLAWALADAACKVVESSESNNTKSASYLVTAAPDMALPDSALPDLAVPDAAQPDQTAPDAAPDAGAEAAVPGADISTADSAADRGARAPAGVRSPQDHGRQQVPLGGLRRLI